MPGPRVKVDNFDDLIDALQGATDPINFESTSVATYPADRSSVYRQLAAVVTPGTTTARGAAASTGIVYPNLLSKFDVATFMLQVTAAATEAGDTLDVFIDLSLDLQVWFNGIHFTQLLGNGGAKTFVAEITHPTAAVNPIDVTSDASVTVSRNLWAPHVRIGWNNGDANANTNAIFSFGVFVYLQAK